MKKDGRTIAQSNEERILKTLHKFGWLRTRDIAALVWPQKRGQPGKEFVLQKIVVTNSAVRMAQRTIARLKALREVVQHVSPDGSSVICLAVAGARRLQSLGIPAKPGKDGMRIFSAGQYHHRRLANEIAIVASLQGYRVATEHEISTGIWLGGSTGVQGKKPDVLVRNGKAVWWIEVERSRRNERDYQKLLRWLDDIWPANGKPTLPDGHLLEQILFISSPAFMLRLGKDLSRVGWKENQFKARVSSICSLYIAEAKFILREAGLALAEPV